MSRRALTYALLFCLAGAGLALYAATRTWAVEVTVRPAPLPGLRTARTGGSLLPWLPALAVVGLAGAGAVIATRGLTRRLVGMLLLLIGVGLTAGGGYGVLAVDPGGAGAGAAAWPTLCAVGGLLLAGGGLVTALRGQHWPSMGARYERPPARRDGVADGPVETSGRVEGAGTRQAWDALDRGEDPTVS
ncbi:Trp biosynthesis-associated membrane protein [Micromonospora sp. NPDC049679]|uniref:Trp biosynthesis-associated membrane protein n=1 Tax=Micromonospora sp. NPDC049679 TaxID=3155920 RepID=UPI0033FEFB91